MSTRTRHVTETPGPSSQRHQQYQDHQQQPRESTSTRLPDYEAPRFPMNVEAQTALAALYAKHDFSKLQNDITAAMTLLTNSVTDINERLSERKHKAEQQTSRKRKASSQDDPESSAVVDVDDGKSLEFLCDKIQGMTKRMDDTVRKMIDGQQSLKDAKESIMTVANEARAHASTQASIQQSISQRQDTADEQDEEDDEDEEGGERRRQEPDYPDITPTDPAGTTETYDGPSKSLTNNLESRKLQYQNKTLVERYTGVNTYREFRGLLHNAQYPDDSVPMPGPEEWFQEGSIARPGQVQRGNADDEEDFQIQRATTSTKCPITLQEFVTPLSSKKCPHTFEASAIREMISHSTSRINQQPNGRGGVPAVRCPVQGCSKMISLEDVGEDTVVKHKIKKLQQAKRLREQEGDHDRGLATIIDDDDDDDNEDDGYDIDELEKDERHRPVKSELASSRA